VKKTKTCFALGLTAVVTGLVLMFGFGNSVQAQEDITAHPSCSYCGMDRAKFAHSRVFIEYDDGSTAGTCSIRCAAVEMALHIDKGPVSIKVGDYQSKALINAETAVWVIGGDRLGVMTKRAKWAFDSKAQAESYIQEHGGKLGTFEDAIKAAYEDMYHDTKMIRDKRKKKRKQAD
jgi:hypothetical protein